MAETLGPDVEGLLEELRGLLDRQAIVDCVNRYARGLDRHDVELLETVYHEDALDHHGDFTGPPSEFIPWVNKLHEADWTAHLHFITNNTVEIDGDTAHCESYVFFTLERKDGKGVDLGGGRYIDRLERRNGEWRIAAREVIVDWRKLAEGATYSRAKTYTTGTWDRTDASYWRPLVVEAP